MKYLGISLIFLGALFNVYWLVQGFSKVMLFVGIGEPDYGIEFLTQELVKVGLIVLAGISAMLLGLWSLKVTTKQPR